MEEVVFNNSVKYIPENCFNGCKNLKKIIFQDHIFSINAAAFMGCENLQTIKYIFSYCVIWWGRSLVLVVLMVSVVLVVTVVLAVVMLAMLLELCLAFQSS